MTQIFLKKKRFRKNLRWFKPSDIINTVPIFKLDENNNVIPIVETISENYKIS